MVDVSHDSVRVVTHEVAAPAERVYAYARVMENLPRWASGLAAGIRQENGRWFSDSPMGRVGVEMAPENGYGVLDHEVTLPDGTVVHNPFRVVPVGARCLLMFVLVRQRGMSDDAFDADEATILKDLAALARIVQSP